MSNQTLVVNFGGPRSLEEIEPFLKALLNDRDVIWSSLPKILHRIIFSIAAKKRAVKIAPDYHLIGGFSPIFKDTEAVARYLGPQTLTFHRYLPKTHAASLEAIKDAALKSTVYVLPLFPQFSYATTGSIARFFDHHLPHHVVRQLRWIKSYAAHPAYVKAMQVTIGSYLADVGIQEEEVALLFSAHGVPRCFTCRGDIYESECQISYKAIKAAFHQAIHQLSYQSKFGPGEWIRPYTQDLCSAPLSWTQGRKKVVIVPLTFTSDHIETLFEIEHQYLPLLRHQGIEAFRCPALNLSKHWLEALPQILQETNLLTNDMLIRPNKKRCCGRFSLGVPR